MTSSESDRYREIADGAAILSGAAVFLNWIPEIVGVVTIIYTIWRIVEALDHRKRVGMFPFAPFGHPVSVDKAPPGKPE
jgi:hypothetical protein